MFAAQKIWFRGVCWLMAVVTPLAPSAAVYAQASSENRTLSEKQVGEVARYLVPNPVAVVSLRPQQVLESKTVEMLPVEVLVAAALEEIGIDPTKVESVRFSLGMSFGAPPDYAAVVTFSERVDFSAWKPQLTRHTVKAKREGQTYLQSQDPRLPSVYWMGGKSILLAPERILEKLLTQADSTGPMYEELALGAGDDTLLLIDMVQLRPLIQAGLVQVASEIPSEIVTVLELPNLIQRLRLKVNVSGAGPIDLSLEANDAKSADRVEEILDQVVAYYKERAAEQAERMLESDDPIQQAMGRYTLRVSPRFGEGLLPVRTENRFTLFNLAADDSALSGTTMVAVSGVLVGLLLPAVQAAREAARRNTMINNMRHMLLALLTYESANGRFPAYANFDDEGKPLLSWRVHMLPYLDQQGLYNQFHLDEPWDSEHNKKLIPLMPQVFLDPSSPLTTSAGRTHCLGVSGEGHLFDGVEGTEIRRITDGTSNTIAVVQCNDESAVTWTKPEDWQPDSKSLLKGLKNGPHPEIFIAGFVDGHVTAVSEAIDPEEFKKLLTIAGGEIVHGF